MNIATTGNESEQHQRAKLRLLSIIENMGMTGDFEIRTGSTQTSLGERKYTADIFAFWKGKKIIFEVRGYKGHNTKWANFKDRIRDEGHQQKNIKTVRIEMKDLVGKKKLDDDIIKADINWQLNNEVLSL